MRCILFSAWLSTCLLANPLDIWADSHKAYEEGNYHTAIKKYSELLQQIGDKGDLHYNLGNSYYRNQQLGIAIFHFRKAKDLKPRDPDIRFNLNYTREKVTDKIEPRGFKITSWVPSYLNTREWLYSLVLLSLGASLVAVVQYFKPRDIFMTLRNCLMGLFIIASILAFIQIASVSPFGVVTVLETKVYSGIGRDNVLLFTLHEGTEVEVADTTEPGWVQIGLADGKKGWMRTEGLKL